MSWDDDLFSGVEEADIRREKAKARELRQSRWWQNKLAEGRCHYCEQIAPKAELTMDHVVPLTRGGKSVKGNLVVCCKECNNRKKNLLPLEWEDFLEKMP
ncbi:MAG: HNH endonuclease [Desulfobulbaceae bacterium]|nr:HNH endonuclease [Desulfobulbaceae bacterium]